jgi:hypothetical protein
VNGARIVKPGMAKTWVLDTETKGTGAEMVPLEKTLKKPADKPARRAAPANASAPARTRTPRAPRREPERTATALPAGHVRKKGTGEIGRVESVDSRAGTATVHWLKRGASSTVPLSSLSRR